MDRIRIKGGTRLNGEIAISGAKNAALPLMAASLLTDEALVLTNMPWLADIRSMTDLLESLGAEADFAGVFWRWFLEEDLGVTERLDLGIIRGGDG